MAESPLLRKLVRDAYDRLAGRGAPFELVDVVAAVLDDPAIDGVRDEVLSLAVDGEVRRADNSRTAPPPQTSLFGDLDRVLALGEGRRRRKGDCDATDMATHIALVNQNVAMVTAAAAREQQEYALLLPFLSQGMTVDQAVIAYAEAAA